MRELGAMKAIGLPARRIRGLYLLKYAALVLAGGAVGLLVSIPASRGITAGLRYQLGAAPVSFLHFLVPVLSAVLVVLFVLGMCALLLRRLDRITAMDALREGTTGNVRHGRGMRPTLARTFRLHPSVWMGLNDITRSVRSHGMLLAVLTLCTVIMVMPLNFATTVASPTFITYMGAGVSDLRFELRNDDAMDQVPKILDNLAADPDVGAVAAIGIYPIIAAGIWGVCQSSGMTFHDLLAGSRVVEVEGIHKHGVPADHVSHRRDLRLASAFA